MWRDFLTRSIWLTTGSAAGRLLPYLVLIGLGRNLASADFASLAVGFAWSAVAASLTTSGLANVATQRLALVRDPALAHRFICRVGLIGLCLALLLGMVTLLVGPRSVSVLFGKVLAPDAVFPGVVNGVMWSLTLLAIAMMNGLHRPRSAAVALGVGGLFQGLGMFLGHLWGNGVSGMLWGLTAGSAGALGWTILSLVGSHKHPPSGVTASDQDPNRHLWSATAWNSLAAACVTPVTLGASSLLTHGTQGAQQLAAFHALEQAHQLAVFVPGILAQALLPALTVRLHEDPASGIRSIIRLAVLLALGGSVLALSLAWEPHWFHRLLGNPALTQEAATRWMFLHAGLSVALGLVGSALLARGRYAIATYLNLIWAASFWSLSLLLVDDGASGLQLARLCASWTLFGLACLALWLMSKPATARASGRALLK